MSPFRLIGAKAKFMLEIIPMIVAATLRLLLKYYYLKYVLLLLSCTTYFYTFAHFMHAAYDIGLRDVYLGLAMVVLVRKLNEEMLAGALILCLGVFGTPFFSIRGCSSRLSRPHDSLYDRGFGCSGSTQLAVTLEHFPATPMIVEMDGLLVKEALLEKAVKDDIGTVRIQRPHKGPFYISPKTIDQLIANLGRWARWYKYASVGFTAVGVYLLVKHTFHYVMERKRHWELRRRVLAAAAKRAGHEDEGSLPSLHTSILMFQSLGFFAVKLFYFASFLLLGSNATSENGVDNKKDLLMPDLCVICLEQEYNSVFVP
ncbi:putative mitochondrial ubiquitin ligase activator of nfkb 1-A-like isoform 2 [Capsicum annuum]|nr:putative mitochondrial ubiquitin ligase activator of nfkb 1-A-like isoform 2 [Capsicum annuum]